MILLVFGEPDSASEADAGEVGRILLDAGVTLDAVIVRRREVKVAGRTGGEVRIGKQGDDFLGPMLGRARQRYRLAYTPPADRGAITVGLTPAARIAYPEVAIRARGGH